jgi:putative phage-type endonuclease
MNENNQIINQGTDREGFVALRKNHLGSSEIASILGLNKYQSRYDLWLLKTGRKLPIPEERLWETSMPMFIGQAFESGVLNVVRQIVFQEENGLGNYNVEEFQDTYTLKAPFDFCSCTPDAIATNIETGEQIIVELKTTGEFNKKNWTDCVPDTAHVQVMWQMGIMGIHKAIVAVVVGNRDFFWHQIDFSQELFDSLLAQATAFWEMVKQDVPPEVSEDGAEPTPEFQEQETVMEIDELIQEYIAAQGDKKEHDKIGKELDAKLKGVKARIMLVMGRYGKVRSGRYLAVKQVVERKGYPVPPTSYTDLKIKVDI